MNLFLRQFLRVSFELLSYFFAMENFVQRKIFLRKCRARPASSVRPSGYEAQIHTLECAFQHMKEPFWVTTSGTRATPKKIPYNKNRIKLLTHVFLKAMVTLTAHKKGLKTFFVFSSLGNDDSLTASMTAEEKPPRHIELLQAPYRYLSIKDGRALREKYGDLCARLAVILVTRPRFFYATNPSTIVHFLREVRDRFPELQALLQKLLGDQEILKPLLKLSDGNGAAHLLNFCQHRTYSVTWLKELQATITWDGGYVKSFVSELSQSLPQCEHIPMYSMSTEAVESLPHRIKGSLVFLPVIPGVFPEFWSASGEILKATELKKGESYTLLITDQWGLERYDTGDVFHVKAIIDGLPDLEFQRRRNVTASVTGEKITEEQTILLFTFIKARFPELQDIGLALYPELTESHQGYWLILMGGQIPHELEAFAQEKLSEINHEYHAKVMSKRLQPLKVRQMTVPELAKLMQQEHRWESQFKVMPLYEKPVTKA